MSTEKITLVPMSAAVRDHIERRICLLLFYNASMSDIEDAVLPWGVFFKFVRASGICSSNMQEAVQLETYRTVALGSLKTCRTSNGAGGIGLQVQRRICTLTGGPSHAFARLAAELDIQHRPDGITVCGTARLCL